MKKLIVFCFLVVIGLAVFSQENQFGITVREYDEIQVESGVRDTLHVQVDWLYMQFYNNGRIIFGYNIYYTNSEDVRVKTKMNQRESVPLDVEITAAGQTKTVLEWIQSTRTTQDTTILSGLAGRVAKYYSLGALQ